MTSKESNPVRVRIAPSPTGDPHVGLAYMTLFNYAFAKKNSGNLILRIEDTDQERAKSSSEELIMQSLKWLGLSWDEGPDIGGPHAPYKQSERTHIYREHTAQLVARGKAYFCFCTQERLHSLRESQKSAGLTTGYDRLCRGLAPSAVEDLKSKMTPFVIRLKMPLSGTLFFEDILRGRLEFDHTRFDDQVLLKSDGFPTYHLANVVDDHLMGISHVLRAEEWISSTPKHVVLYDAFGWESPKFAHLPLLRNLDRSKISKRKNPISLNFYRRKGILPQALLNFLALMGWSLDGKTEKFSISQMIEHFKLENIHLGGPVFDLKKLSWLNQKYIQDLTQDEFVAHLQTEIFSKENLSRLFPLVRERLDSFDEFVDRHGFFFTGGLDYSKIEFLPKGMEQKAFAAGMVQLLEALDDLYVWKSSELETLLEKSRADLGWKAKDFFMPLRLIVTGRSDSPPIAACFEAVGREMVRHRLREALMFLLGKKTS